MQAYAPGRDRIAALTDMGRAASLADLRLEVSVAHTKQRLRARFCVSLRRAHRPTWAFGIDMKQAKHFISDLRHEAKAYASGKQPCGTSHCPMCIELYNALSHGPKIPAFSSVGKRHLDDKCELLAAVFQHVFQLLSRNASWLQSCELLRETLRRTETLCRIQYDGDDTTVRVLESLTRVTPVIRTPVRNHNHQEDATADCSICLGSVYEPAETATETTTLTRQPTQGVELPCGHRFHDSCISLWFHTRLNCPVCRQAPTTTNESK